MKDQVNIRIFEEKDYPTITSIFNGYVVEGYAAYLENPVDERFCLVLKQMAEPYPVMVAEKMGEVVGFGYLKPWNPLPAFRKAAEVGYFLSPSDRGKGVGALMLSSLETVAADKGIRTLLASVSSRNPGSIRFHRKQGFAECGCFINIGEKFGDPFDVIYMQKSMGVHEDF